MPISSTDNRWPFEGDGVTKTFFYTNKIFAASDLRVFLKDAEQLGGFTVTGVGVQTGGSVIFDVPPGKGVGGVIVRDVPVNQLIDFIFGGRFPSQNTEDGLDKSTVIVQQLLDVLARSIRLSINDPTSNFGELPLLSENLGRYLAIGGDSQIALVEGTAESADLSTKTVLPTGASQARTIADLFGLGALTAENVRVYGAKGDLNEAADGAMTEGQAVLSSGSVTFTDNDIGKAVWVEAAATTGKVITNVAPAPIDAAWQFESAAGAFADLTADLNDSDAADVEPFPASEAIGDAFYLGHVQTFNAVTFDIGTSGAGGAVVWEYWNGSAWSTLTATDATSGFTAAAGNHDLTFTPPIDWAPRQLNPAINGRNLYYIRARLTAVYTTNPVLDQATLSGGRIRVTAALHLIEPLQTVSIKGVAGTIEANGLWPVERIDNDRLDLMGPSFVNAYVSGGTVHGRLETTISSAAGGEATLAAAAGASVAGVAIGYGTDDTAAIQAAFDTGKAVVVPDGNYLASTLKIRTDGQKLMGLGGRIAALPAALHGSSDAQISVEADLVEITGLYLDNPTLQSKKADPWPNAINIGIMLRGSKINAHHNIVRRYRDGIRSSFSAKTGLESVNNVIANNLILDLLGSGSGAAQGVGNQGLISGDGISTLGTATVISGNVIQTRAGADCRNAILCVGVTGAGDPENPGSGAVITGNFIRGSGLDARNGRFYWGVSCDNFDTASIVGNAICGVNRDSIEISPRGSGGARKGNIAVVGNSIVWDSPAVDVAGSGLDALQAAISLFTIASADGAMSLNMIVANNTIKVIGSLESGMLVYSSGDLSGLQLNTVIQGNTILAEDGSPLRWFIRTIFGIEELVIHGNSLRGLVDTHALYIQRGAKRGVISSNVIRCLARTSGSVIFGDGIDAGAVDRVVIEGNVIDGGGGNGVTFQNVASLIIDGNVLNDIGNNGVNGFQVARGVLSSNIFSNIGGAYTINWTPSATKVDANNVKN